MSSIQHTTPLSIPDVVSKPAEAARQELQKKADSDMVTIIREGVKEISKEQKASLIGRGSSDVEIRKGELPFVSMFTVDKNPGFFTVSLEIVHGAAEYYASAFEKSFYEKKQASQNPNVSEGDHQTGDGSKSAKANASLGSDSVVGRTFNENKQQQGLPQDRMMRSQADNFNKDGLASSMQKNNPFQGQEEQILGKSLNGKDEEETAFLREKQAQRQKQLTSSHSESSSATPQESDMDKLNKTKGTNTLIAATSAQKKRDKFTQDDIDDNISKTLGLMSGVLTLASLPSALQEKKPDGKVSSLTNKNTQRSPEESVGQFSRHGPYEEQPTIKGFDTVLSFVDGKKGKDIESGSVNLEKDVPPMSKSSSLLVDPNPPVTSSNVGGPGPNTIVQIAGGDVLCMLSMLLIILLKNYSINELLASKIQMSSLEREISAMKANAAENKEASKEMNAHMWQTILIGAATTVLLVGCASLSFQSVRNSVMKGLKPIGTFWDKTKSKIGNLFNKTQKAATELEEVPAALNNIQRNVPEGGAVDEIRPAAENNAAAVEDVEEAINVAKNDKSKIHDPEDLEKADRMAKDLAREQEKHADHMSTMFNMSITKIVELVFITLLKGILVDQAISQLNYKVGEVASETQADQKSADLTLENFKNLLQNSQSGFSTILNQLNTVSSSDLQTRQKLTG